ncbi:hypothetical protein SUDANB1_05309 [Streptomyces sp. enrichment culture]
MQEASLGAPGARHRQHDQAGGERHEDPAAGAALGDPGGRDAAQGAGGDDPVERRALRHAPGAVAGDDDRVVPGGCQVPAGRLGDLRVEVDGGDLVVAQPVGQQRRVVAGAGADLQDRVALRDTQRGQHVRHQGGLAAGGHQLAVAQPGGQRGVLVGAPHPPRTRFGVGALSPAAFVAARDTDVVVRHEEVPRDRREGLPPARVGVPGPARPDPPHQRLPRGGGEIVELPAGCVTAHVSTVGAGP